MKANMARVEYVTVTIAAGAAALQTAVHAFLEGLGEAQLVEPVPAPLSDGTNYVQAIWYTEGS